MRYRVSTSAVALATALLAAPAIAQVVDFSKYPDLRGQWDRRGPPISFRVLSAAKASETGRAWLGVRIQQVTNDIADRLGVKPVRGALVADIDDKGPARDIIEPGDVIVEFDGKDIKEMRDLPRVVADTPVGKDVAVVIIRKGKEDTKTVKLGRLEDGEKQQQASLRQDASDTKPVINETLGLDISNMTDDLREQYKIKNSVTGVVVLAVDSNSPASDKRLKPGDIIVELAQEALASADQFRAKIDKLKSEGRRSALLLVADADGKLRFVALALQ
jgi:serine protease Do